MGAIAAVVNKRGENAVPNVVIMLRELTHRGIDAHGVAIPSLAITAKSIEDMKIENLNSPVALGHNLSRIFPRDHPQPVLGDHLALVFEGHLFAPSNISEVDEIREKLRLRLQRNAGSFIREFEGSYSFAIACPKKVIAGRDMFGINSLHYGENETACAIASERKALWALGIENVKSFPPGNLAVVSPKGVDFQPIKTVAQPLLKSVNMNTAAKHLQNLLLESTRKRISDLKKVAVAFSGGLDSSIIANLAKICGIDVHLISVGLKGQAEVEYAKATAERLDLPLHLEAFTVNDVEQVLPKVLWLIEESNAVKASIAIPFFWTAEIASKMKCHVLLAGQGSDELFGGYHRYLGTYAQFGITAVQNAMYHDIASSFEKNFQRDTQVCSFHKVELRLPFVDREIVKFALGLPVGLKIKSMEDRLRKRVLRRVAQNLELPQFIVDKPKKAIQYTTGVNKTLQRLARKESLTLREYVKRVFRTVYPLSV
ncbi:MAG: asparagine synthetase B [Candidatus Bathyarchaeota archaeon]|nr:MAG: asparagine synthetase B [Candidatus Bathyarchaeota archaeon]